MIGMALVVGCSQMTSIQNAPAELQQLQAPIALSTAYGFSLQGLSGKPSMTSKTPGSGRADSQFATVRDFENFAEYEIVLTADQPQTTIVMEKIKRGIGQGTEKLVPGRRTFVYNSADFNFDTLNFKHATSSKLAANYTIRVTKIRDLQPLPVTPLSNMPSIANNCHLGGSCAGSSGTVHTGVDYLSKSGTQVRAICDGTVKYSKAPSSDIWSRFVVIEHPNCGGYSKLYAYYGHVNWNSKTAVKRGDVIGSVSDWGKNSHLHFGLATKLFNTGWGYQSGNPVHNGWVNPASFKYQ